MEKNRETLKKILFPVYILLVGGAAWYIEFKNGIVFSRIVPEATYFLFICTAVMLINGFTDLPALNFPLAAAAAAAVNIISFRYGCAVVPPLALQLLYKTAVKKDKKFLRALSVVLVMLSGADLIAGCVYNFKNWAPDHPAARNYTIAALIFLCAALLAAMAVKFHRANNGNPSIKTKGIKASELKAWKETNKRLRLVCAAGALLCVFTGVFSLFYLGRFQRTILWAWGLAAAFCFYARDPLKAEKTEHGSDQSV